MKKDRKNILAACEDARFDCAHNTEFLKYFRAV